MIERRKLWWLSIEGVIAVAVQIGTILVAISLASGSMMADNRAIKSEVKELQDWRMRQSQETTEIHEDVRWIRTAIERRH